LTKPHMHVVKGQVHWGRPTAIRRYSAGVSAREVDIRAVQGALDLNTFAEAWTHGLDVTPPQALAYALGGT
jgi:hypothetical protein